MVDWNVVADAVAAQVPLVIDLSGVERVKGESFRWKGKYSYDLQSRDTLETRLGVFANFQPRIPASFRNAEWVFLGNIDPELQLSVLDQIKKPRLVACDTMNYWINGKRDVLLQLLRHIDVLMVNDSEARQLSGEFSLVKAARKIMAMGPKYLIIKKGEHGALLFHENQVFFAPALPLEDVFDPTGAGDTFAGGFIGHIARTKDLSFENMKTAIIVGSAMASFCVEKFGPERLRSLDKHQIDERIRQFVDLVNFDIQLV